MRDVIEQVRSLTGRSTRLVWTRQLDGCTGYAGMEGEFALMAFDTERGERRLLEETATYANPLLTADGRRVVYTSNTDGTVQAVNWDGSGKRCLGPGYALTVWHDPETGVDWVYTRPPKQSPQAWYVKSKPITRFQLDDPDVREVVWEKKSISWCWLQLSKDGQRAATVMSWPRCGWINFSRGEFVHFDDGCWTAMAPDNSYRMWVFDANHREVKLYDRDGKRICVLDLHQCPGVKGWEIYHPRWSNHPRFVTVTGPYSDNRAESFQPKTEEERKAILIPQGGYNVELYLGRLNPEATAVEEWVRITENDKGDFYGDAWIAPA